MKVKLLTITPRAEKLVENAGRTCYKSKPKEGYKHGNLIRALIKSGHSSVLEHAVATFRISEVSRALTHQLVRHRLASFSQQSQRYVSENQFGFVIPKSIYELQAKREKDGFDGSFIIDFQRDMSTIQAMYNKWKERGLKSEDARYVLPNACHTEIVITANMREFRKICQLRCDPKAQWEIRDMATLMLVALYKKCPNIFEDLYQKYYLDNIR